MNYITTNIRIPEDDYLRLKEEAAKRRKSLSFVIREKVAAKKPSKKAYLKKLLSLKTDWFTEKDYKEYLESRKQLKKRMKMYEW